MKQRKTEQDEAYLATLKEKKLLSVEEAADLFGIGRTKIRELSSGDNCPFVLWIGGHRKIKREEFEKYISDQFSI
ncbi:MAG: helix-turn-helix domain-containing protein [Saccharofermentans sp.]|nr:helix-turn-helix domain-containing protein [Saccharofermentans sp.]